MSDFACSYAVYISPIAVELHNDQHLALAQGRCVCKQASYLSILRFARNLALHRRLPLRNYAKLS
jgi:hypothetical protein